MVVRFFLGAVALILVAVGCSEDSGQLVTLPTVVPDDAVVVSDVEGLVGLLDAGGLACSEVSSADPTFGLNRNGIDHELPNAARCRRSAPGTDVLLYVYPSNQSRQDAISTGELNRNACALFGGSDLSLDALVGANWRIVARHTPSGENSLATGPTVVAQAELIDCRTSG